MSSREDLKDGRVTDCVECSLEIDKQDQYRPPSRDPYVLIRSLLQCKDLLMGVSSTCKACLLFGYPSLHPTLETGRNQGEEKLRLRRAAYYESVRADSAWLAGLLWEKCANPAVIGSWWQALLQGI